VLTEMKLILALNHLHENPSDASHRRSQFKVYSILGKEFLNKWMWMFYGGARNAWVTTGSISSTCCKLGGYCLWLPVLINPAGIPGQAGRAFDFVTLVLQWFAAGWDDHIVLTELVSKLQSKLV
jgi:hypothetical protein